MTATAAEPAVQLSSVSVTPNEPNTGERVTFNATIANLENSDSVAEITDVYVRSPGSASDYARVEDVGSIAPGGSLSIPISTTFDQSGEKRLNLHLVVQDENGNFHSYTYPMYVDVTEPTVRADLSTELSNNRTDTTKVSLTNFGNTDLSNIEITAVSNGEVIDQNYLLEIHPNSNRSTVFDTSSVSAETIQVTANYTAAGDRHSTSFTVDLDDQTTPLGEIRLTGVETIQTGTGVQIQGDAANLGGTDTQSVLVRVPQTEKVSPTAPTGEYFIGAIDGSEFATFELTAQTESNVSTVPVEITYIVDNERVTKTQEIELGGTGPSMGVGAEQMPGSNNPGAGHTGGPGNSHSSGGLSLTIIGIAAVSVLVIGFGVYRWRSQ
ncbi:hypothetical protein [Halobellus rufus]|uniref:hypothetical protein n=1 Tax=Halobellus rufus TaxID=1448860 RepID=UPI001E3F8590|nr:hypothetical protein [Halobellus rufus]